MQSSSSNDDLVEEEEETAEQKMAVTMFYEELKRFQEEKGEANPSHIAHGWILCIIF